MKSFSSFVVFIFIVFASVNNISAEVITTGSASDNNGNITIIGNCLGNVSIFEQQFNFTSPAAFILRLNPDGDLVWIKILNSSQQIKANAIRVDNTGNSYITGEFSGSVNFDSFTLTAQGTDAYILKLNSNGNVDWVKQGTSPGDARGNDIYISGEQVYVCGDGKPISFDTLSISGGGFVVAYNLNGEIQNLFRVRDFTFSLHTDINGDIIIFCGEYDNVFPGSYYPVLAKYSINGNYLWVTLANQAKTAAVCTDNFANMYFSSLWSSGYLDFYKYDFTGNLLKLKSFEPNGSHQGRSMLYDGKETIIVSGYCSNLNFGNSTVVSNGMTDAYVAKLDTNFNPIWIKSGGGLYQDEFNKVSLLSEGSIIASGNFRGVIEFEGIDYTGGTGIDDLWAAIAKFDNDGNLVWFKKIAENYTEPSTVNWFPLEVGNKWQFFKSVRYFNPNSMYFSILNVTVTDSIYLNSKKFYKISSLVYLTNVPVRFDVDLQKIFVYINNLEHTYMDFNLPDGANFQQIQNNGTYYTLSAASKDINLFNNTVTGKGFYTDGSYEEGWYIFAPDIGFAFQDEVTLSSPYPYYSGPEIDLVLLEYLINNSSGTRHQKHNYHADIQFEPIYFLPDTAVMKQEFKINHNYSILSGVSYISNAFVESFYQKENDTIWNPDKSITALTEIDFALDIQLDTNLYNQGYHLYYKIVARDKGIIPSYYFKPEEGYYKLYWRDSTSTFVQADGFNFEFSLSQNYPNPFNPSTSIEYRVGSNEYITLKVFDVLGREVATLVNEEKSAGVYKVEFDASNLSSGIYYYQLKAGSFIESKKMVVVK